MGYHLTITQELPEHRKFLHLYRLLSDDERSLIFGCMIRLYLWGIKEAPDGVLGNAHPISIAEAAGYPGDAERFVDALTQSQILDVEDGDFAFNPIPREELASGLDKFLKASAERQRKYRERHKRQGAKGKPPKEPKPKNPDIKIFLDAFHDRYKIKTGQKYHVAGGKDGKAIERLLKTYSLDELTQHMNTFFTIDDKFTQEAGYSVGVFASQINKIAGGQYGKDRKPSQHSSTAESGKDKFGNL